MSSSPSKASSSGVYFILLIPRREEKALENSKYFNECFNQAPVITSTDFYSY
jgi:hypothetical protein